MKETEKSIWTFSYMNYYFKIPFRLVVVIISSITIATLVYHIFWNNPQGYAFLIIYILLGTFGWRFLSFILWGFIRIYPDRIERGIFRVNYRIYYKEIKEILLLETAESTSIRRFYLNDDMWNILFCNGFIKVKMKNGVNRQIPNLKLPEEGCLEKFLRSHV
ncbi:MAG: hypothetical protein QXU98_09280 [Candidatus Parvarchaeota archaeon]